MKRSSSGRSRSPPVDGHSRGASLAWALVAVFVMACHAVSMVAIHEAGHCAMGAWPEGCTVYLAPLEGYAVVHGSESAQHAVIYTLHVAFIFATVAPAAALAAMKYPSRKPCSTPS